MRSRRGKDWEREQPSRDIRDRQLPHHPDAEASVLGGVLLSNETLALLDHLEVDDFYDHKNKVVFAAMRNLEAAGRPIDIVTLEHEVSRGGKLEALGGVAYLGELTLRVPTVDNVEEYARIVRADHITRQVMVMLSNMLDEAYHGESEGEQLVHDVTTAVMSVGTGGERAIVTMAQLISEEAERVHRDVEIKLAGGHVVSGVPTGLTQLDEIIGGHPIAIPTLYIARPAAGKTTVAMQVNEAAGRIGGVVSILASYEDRGQSFGQRALAKASGMATDLIRARKITRDDLATIAAGHVAGQGRGEMFLAASGMSAEALVRRVRRENLKRRHKGLPPVGQLLVDYVQKMPMPEHSRSRDEGISHISTTLSQAAVDENMALVMFAQLNREVEKRDDHKPRLSDIRDSGSLEQDGKLIVGLYRPWTYEPNKYPQHELHALVLKNHNGEDQLDIKLYWDVKTHAIYNSEVEWGGARNVRRVAHEQQAMVGDNFANRFDEAGGWDRHT